MIEQATISDMNYTVLLCVDYDEKVLRRYTELLKACKSEGGKSENFGYINRRSLRISEDRTIQYNLILGLGGDDAADIAQRISDEGGEIAVAFFDLSYGEDTMVKVIDTVRDVFPQLICAVAINREMESPDVRELFSSPSEWLYFLRDYTPEQMEQLIAHLISSYVLHREKETALAQNVATRLGLRQILGASPELLQQESHENLVKIILEYLFQLTGATNTFLIELNPLDGKLSYVAGTGNFATEEEFKRDGYDKKSFLLEEVLTGKKLVRIKDGIIAPLLVQNKKIGLLFFDQERPLTRGTELLDVFAQHVAFAIENHSMQIELGKKRALEHELNLASRIQTSLLPKSFPEIPNAEVYGITRSAKEIGGDYFDVLSLDNNFYFCIGDVSGKGVGAGLIMSELRSIVRSFAMSYNAPREILLHTAQLLLKDIGGSGKFVSMLLFQWDGKKLVYSSAGHEHILHYHRDRKVCEAYRSGGVVLGANIRHFTRLVKEEELIWKAGDAVVLFTDGATEARNGQKEMFGMPNLQKAVEQYAALPVQEMIAAILQEILKFVGDTEQHDDITLLGLKYL